MRVSLRMSAPLLAMVSCTVVALMLPSVAPAVASGTTSSGTTTTTTSTTIPKTTSTSSTSTTTSTSTTSTTTTTTTIATTDNSPWTVPDPPPSCTAAQTTSGNVGGCLLVDDQGAVEDGWPAPPFPSASSDPTGVGVVPLDGWQLDGFAYNGSPALAAWEAQLVANETAIGRVKAAQLRSLPDALPLFEGFLRDIQAGGYRVSDAATYSFRCTSSTRVSCAGLTRSSLSNHSWGLALDMNSGTNANTSYVGVNGATACATPISTDFPHWVIQTAEKWGLYWGGYGWGSCSSPTDQRTSITRDAPHFEFQGTPAEARAIAARNLGDSCLQVADDAGTISPRCLDPGATPPAGWRVVVDTKAPAGATAALVNLAMTGATNGGYVTAESCGAAPAGPRATASGNVAAGATTSNLAVVPLDAQGRFCLYRSQAMHTVVDVEGFFAPAAAAPNGSLFTVADPARALDTRTDPWCAPSGTCSPGMPPAGSDVAVVAPQVPAAATAVLADLAVTATAAAGYLTADACSNLVPGPQSHANGNFVAHDTVANLAVVPVLPGATGAQFCLYDSAALHDVVDVQGWFAPPSATGLGFIPSSAQRLVDTRGCWTDALGAPQPCGQPVAAGGIVHLHAPPGAQAVLVNLALTQASADGFATAQACSTLQPTESNGNVTKGGTISNLAVVGVDPDGTFCVRTSQEMHVVVDLEGTFTSAASASGTTSSSTTSPSTTSPGTTVAGTAVGGLRFLATTPTRRSDTRSS